MKLLWENPEMSKENLDFNYHEFELKSMVCLGAGGMKYDNLNTLEFYFAAKLINDISENVQFIFKLIIINESGEDDNEFIKLVNSLNNTHLFMNNPNKFDFIANNLNSFISKDISEDNIYISDFYFKYEDNIPYFYALSSFDKKETKYIKVKCKKSHELGINILFRGISRQNINDEIFDECNKWLLEYYSENHTISFETLDSFKILDISRSVKIAKNRYGGAVVLKFDSIDMHGIHRESTTVMNYIRTTKVNRTVASTIDFLQAIYGKDCYSLSNICGQNVAYSLDNAYIYIIGFNKENVKIFKTKDSLHKEIISEIEKV